MDEFGLWAEKGQVEGVAAQISINEILVRSIAFGVRQ